MDWVGKFAVTTPYELFVEFKNVMGEVWPVIKEVGSAFKYIANALGGGITFLYC